MDPLERRLSSHLGAHAALIEPVEQEVARVMNEGRRKKNGRTLLIGSVAAVAVVGVAVATVAILGRDTREETLTPAETPLSLGLNPATEVPANFSWSLQASADRAGRFGSASWWAGGAATGLSGYTFGSAPIDPTAGAVAKADQQLFRTEDGVDYAATTEPFDPWISSLDATQADRIYALGTVPDGASFGYQVGVSTDEGASWATAALPLNLPAVRNQLGGVGVQGAQIVNGESNAIAIVQPVAFVQNVRIAGVDTSFGIVVTAEGVGVYGAPDDLDAIGRRECPPGWSLQEGSSRQVGNADTGPEAVPATVMVKPGMGGGMWHCESPGGDQPDMDLDPSRIHGEVVRVVPFEDLGLDDASVAALRNSVRVFHTTDGISWAEADTPIVGIAGTPPTAIWTGSEFVLRSAGVDGPELWLSPDGVSWSQGELPKGGESLSVTALPDGTLLAAGRTFGELVAYTSTDGSTWTGVSLAGLVDLDASWRVTFTHLVSAADGTSLLLSAAPDPYATVGAPTVDHGRFTLRLADSQGAAELLDDGGQVLDRLDNIYAGSDSEASAKGILHMNGTGTVNVVDPATGAVVDTFSNVELDQATQEIWNDSRMEPFQNGTTPSAWWALDTVDGTHWGITRIDGIGSSNIWLASNGQATPGGHAYRLSVGETGAVIIGRRT